MFNFSKRVAFLSVLAATLLASATASAQYVVYTTIGFPKGGEVKGWGLNAKARVGIYNETIGAGYIYDMPGNVFESLPVNATPMGINDDGVVVGSVFDGSSNYGFILDGGVSKKFVHPAGGDTYGRGISSKGQIAGYAIVPATGQQIGYIYDPQANVFTNIIVPGAVQHIAQGINSAGDVVGSVQMPANTVYAGSPAGAYGFIRQASGAVMLFRVNGVPTRARGINDEGMVTGWFTDPATSTFKSFAVKLDVTGSFANINLPATAILEVPGATSTIAEGINAVGEISGQALFANGPAKAFVAAPPSSVK